LSVVSSWKDRRKKNLFAEVQNRVLHFLSVLLLFVLILAASGFLKEKPFFGAGIIFLFSLAYLYAGAVIRIVYFLYPGMLLGAVGYFLTCYGAGAPPPWFPALAVPLVWLLWLIGQRVRTASTEREDIEPFSPTIFRAMSITACAFSGLALFWIRRYAAASSAVAFVPAIAFYGFSALYLCHRWKGAASMHGYVGAAYLLAGGLSLAFVSTLRGAGVAGPVVVAGTFLTVWIATQLHRSRGEPWNRPYYFAAAAMGAVGLLVAGGAPYRWLLSSASLASVLALAYFRMVWAVKSASEASVWERAWARLWLYGLVVIGTASLLVPVVVRPVRGLELLVSGAAFTAVFCAYAKARPALLLRDRNLCAYLAAAWASLTLMAPTVALDPNVRAVVVVVAAIVVMAVLAVLHRYTSAPKVKATLSESVLLPCSAALIYMMFSGGAFSGGAVLATALLLAGAALLVGLDPARRGALISLGVLLPAGYTAAVLLGTAGAPGAAWLWLFGGALLAWGIHAVVVRRGQVSSAASLLGWLFLSAAALIVMLRGGAKDWTSALALTTWIAVSALIARALAGNARGLPYRVVLICAQVIGAAGLLASAVANGSLVSAALALLVLGGAYCLAAVLSREERTSLPAVALVAAAWLMVTFGVGITSVERVFSTLGLVLILHVLSDSVRGRLTAVSDCLKWTGHVVTCFAFVAMLYLFRVLVPAGAVLALSLCALMYGAFAWRKKDVVFLLGALLAVSIAVLMGMGFVSGGPYVEQVPRFVVLACLWVFVGSLLWRRGRKSQAGCFFAAGTVVAILSALLTEFGPPMRGGWSVFVVSGLIAAVLFGILRRDVFGYFVTLSLALLAYQWLKGSASKFTSDVLFYLLIALLALGLVFLLPHLRRLAARFLGVASMSVFTLRGALLASLPIAAAALLTMGAYTIRLTGHPKFCMSCHYMAEYFDSWEHSSHKDVKCITCHYEPGIEAEVRGKLDGLVQFIKYISHSYTGKPHAEISDAACMREGCHSGMDRDDTVGRYNGGVLFNHKWHLMNQVRGKELRCTSCHFQLVQGRHISVTPSTCITCHFYRRGDESVSAGTCLTCHPVPERTVEFAGEPFSHKNFLEGNDKVQCVHCHSGVTEGDGAVSRSRCLACHLERDIDLPPQSVFHGLHVSKQRVDCLQCHDEIKHGTMPMPDQVLTSGNCHECHGGSRHALQEEVYMGTAAEGLEVEPDVMYLAGVSCDGCHTRISRANLARVELFEKISDARDCADCHADEAYGEMLNEWQSQVRSELGELKAKLLEVQDGYANSSVGRNPSEYAELAAKLDALLSRAQNDIATVELDGSSGAHNFFYVMTVLDRARTDLGQHERLLAAAAPGNGEQGSQ
jgi:nitrate/TMAO reductase-like tetraheme cytochrome c subunit